MKVIFLKDLKKQGKKNEIKDVSDGYATNYLIKNGYAVKYTKSSSERLDTEITQNKINEENNIKNALKIKNKLEKEVISFTVSTGKFPVVTFISFSILFPSSSTTTFISYATFVSNPLNVYVVSLPSPTFVQSASPFFL